MGYPTWCKFWFQSRKPERQTHCAQVPVGMHTHAMLMDPEVYSDPTHFHPERWLGDIDPRMKRNFVPFVRGSRSCLGKKYVFYVLLSAHMIVLARLKLITLVSHTPKSAKWLHVCSGPTDMSSGYMRPTNRTSSLHTTMSLLCPSWIRKA